MRPAGALESDAHPHAERQHARCRRVDRCPLRVQHEVEHLAGVRLHRRREAIPQAAAEAEREVIFRIVRRKLNVGGVLAEV
jgi:hypothetical protein